MTRDDKARCEAMVSRYQSGGVGGNDDLVFADEPCGRIAKSRFEMGSRTLFLCHVHDRKLRATGAVGLRP